jgi:hypothetical protein
MEGLPVDQLLVYAGLKNEEVVHARGGGSAKDFAFRSTMQPDEIVALFEGMLTRDGSQFTLGRLEPAGFGGEKGFRFEYFALLYQAPRLAFFPRHRPWSNRPQRQGQGLGWAA